MKRIRLAVLTSMVTMMACSTGWSQPHAPTSASHHSDLAATGIARTVQTLQGLRATLKSSSRLGHILDWVPASTRLAPTGLFTRLLFVQEPAQETDKSDSKTTRPKVRRLPTYYTRVVTQKQREEIYQIQADYEVQLEALQEQIEMMLKERDAKIEGVLEPEQLAEVNRLLEEARQRREARRGATQSQESSEAETDDDGERP